MTQLRAEVRDKIVHLLTIYPSISPSMLQAGLGPKISAKMWRPVLNTMIANDEIARVSIVAKSPSGRHNTYTILSLNNIFQEGIVDAR